MHIIRGSKEEQSMSSKLPPAVTRPRLSERDPPSGNDLDWITSNSVECERKRKIRPEGQAKESISRPQPHQRKDVKTLASALGRRFRNSRLPPPLAAARRTKQTEHEVFTIRTSQQPHRGEHPVGCLT
ncbi:hypothetical protein KIN20_035766 [Parelaphostrongylus tenuis]|uniref:Uncharacterized protein n=1 Tax=Parelaphostrongylus tenuis TaxID=148309 RepID=A0AAD5WKR0_PARTN|nr:hypothetical protein KIN20_035766 [Parelaphostrongylus tenuis]